MSDTIDDDVNTNNSITSAQSGCLGFKRKMPTEYVSVKRIKNIDNDNATVPINALNIELKTGCPLFGTLVDRRVQRRAGQYLIGPKLGYSPVDSIVQYLAKKENTDEFVQLKILMLSADKSDTNNGVKTLQQNDDKILQDERQGKMLLHTEFSLLSLLQDQDGVVKLRGMFSDLAYEEADHSHEYKQGSYYTGRICKRLILVLDCYSAHDFDNKSTAMINLQQYLLKGKLPEINALKIFYEIILVVESLHKKNIIHSDLKLGNIILNKHSNKITIVNFCLGKYLINENDLLYDQRGSPVYISPDVLSGQPYKGKPSDMWALGVVLYMMLYGQFPFYESTTSALFKKIKVAEYTVPVNAEISHESQFLIKGLLQLKSDRRLTATQVRERIESIFASKPIIRSTDQCVPKMKIDTKTTVLLKVKLRLPPTDQLVPSFGKMTVSIPGNQSGVKRKLDNSNGNTRNFIDVHGSSRPSLLLRTQYPTLIDLNLHYHVRRKNLLRTVGSLLIDGGSNSSNTNETSNTIPRNTRASSNNNLSSSSNVIQQMGNLTLRSNYDRYQPDQITTTTQRSQQPLVPSFRESTTSVSLQDSIVRRSQQSSIRQLYRRCTTSLQTSYHELQQMLNQSSMPSSSTTASATSSLRSTPQLQSQPILFRTLQYNQPTFLPPLRQSRFPRLPIIRRSTTNGNDLHTGRTTTANTSSQLVPTLSSSSAQLSPETANRVAVRRFFDAINECIRSNITTPIQQLFGQFDEFTGTITDTLAMKIAVWLFTDLPREIIVQNVFRKSFINCTNKVIDLFTRCGIQMQVTDGIAIINREQPMNLIIILSYILQAAGYNSNYFNITTEVR